MSKDGKTPMLDDLEKGTWPSFVKEIKKAAKRSNTAHDLLGILERSYKDKVTHWKHGGIVGSKTIAFINQDDLTHHGSLLVE